MSLELLECSTLERLNHIWICWIGKYDVAARIEHLGLLQVAYLNFTPYVLRPLSPLEFNALHPKFFDGILMYRQAGVLDVCLNDDGSVTVALVILVEFHSALQIHGINHSAVFDYSFRIHTDDILADGQTSAR